MKKFSNILICTDLDGTLLDDEKRISAENIEAIEYFKQNGGYFTFVTGRMPFFVSNIYNKIHPNAPFGCINGGGLYDCERQEYIWNQEMSREVISMLECVDKELPSIGIQVNTPRNVFFSKDNDTMIEFRRATGLPNLACGYKEVTEPFSKIVFACRENEIVPLESLLRSHPMADRFDFIRSEKTLFEILPKGINKGVSITKLSEYLNIPISKTISVGDYNNDISMFKTAKIGIAVANACPDAKAAADIITVSNDDNAIAKVIYDLDSENIKI
jgi:Cof subfamily protein (haloacid dehalogenase superfamily)